MNSGLINGRGKKRELDGEMTFTHFLLFLVLVTIIYILRAVLSRAIRRQNGRTLSPGAPPLPIIGNLHMLGNLPHQTLHRLSKQYGSIMSIKLGNVPTIVISSPEAAELVLKTHDTVFANRPVVEAFKYMSYGTKGVAFTPYGPYWRNVKKLCTMHLLNASKVKYFAGSRREEVGAVVGAVKKAAERKEVLDVSRMVGGLVEKMTFRMLFGAEEGVVEMQGLVKAMTNLAGAFNVADYVPYLGFLDIQGLRRRMQALSKSMDEKLERIIQKHEQDGEKNLEMDFVDLLLSLMNSSSNQQDQVQVIDRTNIKAILLDMIVGALDTSTTTIEWTFSELMRHPRVMKLVQQELQTVVGLHRMVEETDLPKLTYLDMVIKEIFRLHPTAPLLVPRESMEEIVINGYFIPKKSRIIVNAYAIGRDSNAWSDDNVDEFLPERFADKDVDPRGHDFRLVPFGAGRRGCPGIQLGLTFVRLGLAQLLHCFDWELPNGMLPCDLDMLETFGLAVERATHLLAVPTYRLLC